MTICDLCKKEKSTLYPITERLSDVVESVLGVKRPEICDSCSSKATKFLMEAQEEAVKVKFKVFKDKLINFKNNLD